MTPPALYAMFMAELESEGIGCDPWEALDPREMIAWGKLYRRLRREHGLDGLEQRWPARREKQE